MEVRKVNIIDLEFNPGWYPRDGVDAAHVDALREAIRAGIQLPPILVDNDLRIVDGVHRATAYLNENVEQVDAIVVNGSEEELWLRAASANISHGLPLSLEARRKHFEKAWKAGIIPKVLATEGNEAVAKAYGISESTLKNWVNKARGTTRGSKKETKAAPKPAPMPEARLVEPHVSPEPLPEAARPRARTRSELVAQELVHVVLSAVPDDVVADEIRKYLESFEGKDLEALLLALDVGWPKLVEAVEGFAYEKGH
jgi:transposase-like protein